MWMYNHTPDPDELMHYGVKGMKWKKRIAKGLQAGPNKARTASDIALQRARTAKAGPMKKSTMRELQFGTKRHVKTISYDNKSTKLSNRAQLSAKKSIAKQQVKTKVNRAKRAVKNATNAEARAGYALKAMSTAKSASKAASKKATKAANQFKANVATQIKVAKQKKKNKAMAKKYRNTTQKKNNK